MLYIGFDLGTNCGRAVIRKDNVFSMTKHLPRRVRYKHTRAWMMQCLAHTKQDRRVAYEQPHAGGRVSARVLIGMECMLIDVCEELGLEKPIDVHGMRLKKWFCGSGKATKADMMAEASKRAGREITDDNEADAIAVAFWLRDELEAKP